VAYESGAFKISGYAALPSLTESGRSCQTISVNGRFVRAENLHRGLDNAYRATVPSGRYPPVAVEITADPRRVDVNVHPTKQVVRFSEERAAREALTAAVRNAIEWRPPAPTATPRATERAFTQDRFSVPPAREAPSSPRTVPPTPPPRPGTCERSASASRSLAADDRRGRGRGPSPLRRSCRSGARCRRSKNLRVIGQLAAGYILVEEPESLWVVDQHVAHERAILDSLNDSDSPATVQSLLVPEVVELSPRRRGARRREPRGARRLRLRGRARSGPAPCA
jgi:DNA mismatch repair protein MutL